MNVEVNGVKKAYRKKEVLRGVSFRASDGECIGILGGKGSGKSTLLHVLAGVLKADEGSFLCGGADLLKDDKKRNHLIGFVPQDNPLIPELTAWDNLRLWYDRKVLERELDGGTLSMLGINQFLKVPVHSMSGGMMKRLSLGCAIASSPKVLLLDEPSTALDLICRQKIYDYFEKFRKGGGIIIIATHDVQEISQCSSCHILKEGVLSPYVYDGDVTRLIGIL